MIGQVNARGSSTEKLKKFKSTFLFQKSPCKFLKMDNKRRPKTSSRSKWWEIPAKWSSKKYIIPWRLKHPPKVSLRNQITNIFSLRIQGCQLFPTWWPSKERKHAKTLHSENQSINSSIGLMISVFMWEDYLQRENEVQPFYGHPS